jgi:hypothetical protein
MDKAQMFAIFFYRLSIFSHIETFDEQKWSADWFLRNNAIIQIESHLKKKFYFYPRILTVFCRRVRKNDKKR